MTKCEAIIESYGQKTRICTNCLLNLVSGALQAPLNLANLDVEYSLLGERIASIFLADYTVEANSKECIEKIEQLAYSYRKRILVEQLEDLHRRIGGIVKLVSLEPSYVPVSRALLLGGEPVCRIQQALENDKKKLNNIYEKIGHMLGLLDNNRINLNKLKEEYMKLSLKFREALAHTSIRGPFRLAGIVIDKCQKIKQELVEPGSLVRLPEGKLLLSSKKLEELLAKISKGNWKCKQSSFTSSSLICNNNGRRVIVKIYEKMQVKWIPAFLASPPPVRYLVSARSRLSNEYYWLLHLRRITKTPRIFYLSAGLFSRIMIREYIEGTPVLSSKSSEYWMAAGRELAKIHRHGYVLGDPNPGNFIYSEDYVSIVDAEQARPYSLIAGSWDLVVFVVYALLFNADKSLISDAISAYADSVPSLYKAEKEYLLSGKGWGGVKLLGPYYYSAKKIIEQI